MEGPLVDPGPHVDPGPLVDPGPHVDPGPLVAVTFQKNIHRKDKFLESEPKALGVTQVVLSVYKLSSVGVFQSKGLSRLESDVVIIICSVLVLIAGCVAIAAKNLQLVTLKACLVLQVFSSVASGVKMIYSLIEMEQPVLHCWHLEYLNSSLQYSCYQLESHFFAGAVLMEVALLAISVTLAAYCCKVLNCCGPAPKMPVITVQTAAVTQ